jgi:NTE family protein
MADANTLGVALSGGGSRAAAFHCGTITALEDLKLLDEVDVVSTVSGGSIFGAAWMAARLAGKPTAAFVASMQKELRRGFVLRSLLSLNLPKLLLPGYRRTDLIADTFDRVLCDSRTLGDLPEAPILCMNTSVLNHGQVGKFSRYGFSTRDLGDSRPGGGTTAVPIPGFKLARAASASAAFPVGLPPLLLGTAELGQARRTGLLAGDDPLALSDGGVLENLGVQTLLKGRLFGTWNVVVSDAGQRDVAWRPRKLGQWLTAFAIAALSASSLRRVLELMNDKENRSMRSATVLEAERSWVLERIARATAETLPQIVRDLERGEPSRPRRRLYLARLNQEWDSMLANVPAWRLRELSRAKDVQIPAADARAVESFLGANTEVRLDTARALYRQLGSDIRVAELNRVATGFTSLSQRDLDGLAVHARWQVLVQHALYGTEPRERSEATEREADGQEERLRE